MFFAKPPRMADYPLPKAAAQAFSRQKKMPAPRTKTHPAVKAATDSFASLHGMKCAANAGRGFKRKAK